MMIGLVSEFCGSYARKLRKLRKLCAEEKPTVWSVPSGSDKYMHQSLDYKKLFNCVYVCVCGGHSSMHPKNIFSLLELTLLHFLPSKIGQNWLFPPLSLSLSLSLHSSFCVSLSSQSPLDCGCPPLSDDVRYVDCVDEIMEI